MRAKRNPNQAVCSFNYKPLLIRNAIAYEKRMSTSRPILIQACISHCPPILYRYSLHFILPTFFRFSFSFFISFCFLPFRIEIRQVHGETFHQIMKRCFLLYTGTARFLFISEKINLSAFIFVDFALRISNLQ